MAEYKYLNYTNPKTGSSTLALKRSYGFAPKRVPDRDTLWTMDVLRPWNRDSGDRFVDDGLWK